MVVQGYHAGLTRTRMPLPAISVMVSIATVLALIIDLDRPWQGMFHVSRDALVTVRDPMASEPWIQPRMGRETTVVTVAKRFVVGV